MAEAEKPRDPLADATTVINVGLEDFAGALADQGVEVLHLDWAPPAGSGPVLSGDILQRIDEANQEAVRRMFAAEPVLVGLVPAGEAMPNLGERTILHAGPPIAWADMCGPMQGAIAGIAMFEGWAPDLDAAEAMAAAGELDFRPNHDFDAVGPMTGMTTRSQPVLVVENRAFGNRAFCTLNEGLGKVMRFGGNDAQVLERLAWLRDHLGPAMGRALADLGGIELGGLIARGLAMGDEMHQRNVACSGLMLRALAPALARTTTDSGTLAQILEFIAANDQFFLNIAMAMGKAIMDPVRDIPASTVVTAMSRNGTEFGIRVSGTGDRWFTAPVEMPQGLYFAGFSEADANPDMGDSTIIETVGLGGFAMAAAPAVAGFVGAGTAHEAADTTRAMAEITLAENPRWAIPALDQRGVPSAIDIRLVVEVGTPPRINTGIAHREPGIGQVGAGVVQAPLACFQQALTALAEELDDT